MDSTKTVELLSNEVVAYQDENQTMVNELRNFGWKKSQNLCDAFFKLFKFLALFKFFLK